MTDLALNKCTAASVLVALSGLGDTILLLLLLSVNRLQNHFLLSILLLGGGGNTPVGWCWRGWDSHVTLIRRGGGSGTDVPVGGRQIHSDDRDHGLWVDTSSLTSLEAASASLALARAA